MTKLPDRRGPGVVDAVVDGGAGEDASPTSVGSLSAIYTMVMKL